MLFYQVSYLIFVFFYKFTVLEYSNFAILAIYGDSVLVLPKYSLYFVKLFF